MDIMGNLAIIKMYIERYIGTSQYILFFLVSLVYLWFFCKNRRKDMVYPSVLLGFLIINPVLFAYIWERLFSNTYWRIFWTLPMLPVIAYAMVDVIRRCRRDIIKAAALLATVALILWKGSYVYGEGAFQNVNNAYKLPQEAVAVAEALLALDEEPETVAPASLYCYLRQYSGKIKMLYGRNAEGFVGGMSWNAVRVWNELNSGEVRLNLLTGLARTEGKDYIVLEEARKTNKDDMLSHGYRYVETVSQYEIYENIWDDADNQWKIKSLRNPKRGENIIVITDIYHNVALIDGGTWGNADYVRDIINQEGNILNCWILSSLQSWVSGAYFNITNNPQEVRYTQAIWPERVFEADYSKSADDGDDGNTTWAEAIPQHLAWYKSLEYNITQVGDERTKSVLGMELKAYPVPVQDGGADILADNIYAYTLAGNEESILYLPYTTADRILQLLEKHKEILECDYVIAPFTRQGLPEELKLYFEQENIIVLFGEEKEILLK